MSVPCSLTLDWTGFRKASCCAMEFYSLVSLIAEGGFQYVVLLDAVVDVVVWDANGAPEVSLSFHMAA